MNSKSIIQALEQSVSEYQQQEPEQDKQQNPMQTVGWWAWVVFTLTNMVVIWGTLTSF